MLRENEELSISSLSPLPKENSESKKMFKEITGLTQEPYYPSMLSIFIIKREMMVGECINA